MSSHPGAQDGCPKRLTKRTAFLAFALIATINCREGTDSPTGPDLAPSDAPADAAAPLVFVQVSAGGFHSCGVTEDHRAYCWGANDKGQLGDGKEIINVGRTTPGAVIGDLRFEHVSAGYDHTCGVTTANRVYCWGQNFFGELGNGTQGSDHFAVSVPAEVVGGRRYRTVRAGFSHTCAITLADVAFCWGDNSSGQVGDGTSGANRDRPVRVLGGHRWDRLSGGGAHTCGITRDGEVFCWGRNDHGALGNGTTSNRTRPARVSGNHAFSEVEAGSGHTCAVTGGQRAYCWGINFDGALGDGTTIDRLKPRAVAGSQRYVHINAGAFHTCAVAVGGRGYCWGHNNFGQAGDGTVDRHLMPMPVASTVKWKHIISGHVFHTCGVTRDNRAYCWGAGGLLGNGSTTPNFKPFPVAGQAPEG